MQRKILQSHRGFPLDFPIFGDGFQFSYLFSSLWMTKIPKMSIGFVDSDFLFPLTITNQYEESTESGVNRFGEMPKDTPDNPNNSFRSTFATQENLEETLLFLVIQSIP
jgi:hypothetical protein